MKRSLEEEDPTAVEAADEKTKKGKTKEDEECGCANLDDYLLFEILKHVDARTLGSASCVNKQWNKTAEDERLWEMLCTRHWASKTGNSNQQLRSVVLALGGFRRLHTLCLWPLLKTSSPPPAPSSSSALASTSSLPPAPPMPTHWGKDEVHLSLSLLSIRFYEKMTPVPPRKFS